MAMCNICMYDGGNDAMDEADDGGEVTRLNSTKFISMREDIIYAHIRHSHTHTST